MTLLPTLTNFLGALVIGFGLGLGYTAGAWIIGRVTSKL